MDCRLLTQIKCKCILNFKRETVADPIRGGPTLAQILVLMNYSNSPRFFKSEWRKVLSTQDGTQQWPFENAADTVRLSELLVVMGTGICGNRPLGPDYLTIRFFELE